MARRLPSGGAWSRILPIGSSDPLDSFGLPSKGDTRLNDFKTQESYYDKIVERYMKFCADAGTSTELERQFASMNISGAAMATATTTQQAHGGTTAIGSSNARDNEKEPPHRSTKLQKSQPPAATTSPTASPAGPSAELTTILHAMRKLRESLTATSRTDAFAQRAYVFLVRTAILARSPESYHPAHLHLLRAIHPQCPLSAAELREFVGYAVLDRACRLGEYGAAYAVRAAYGYSDGRVDAVLRALVGGDWVAFWRARRAVDGHQRAIVEWACERMRKHALKCLGRSYFGVEKGFLERAAGAQWEVVVRECGVGWVCEGDWVTIRRPKGK